MDLDVLENLNNDFAELNDEEIMDLIDQMQFNRNSEEDKKILSDTNIHCSKCNSADKIVTDSSEGIVVCTGCGTILENVLDEHPEWRNYAGDDSKGDNSRCNFPTNHFLPQSSLGTSIACSNRSKLKTLHRWSSMPYKERSLHIVLKEIQAKCRKFAILKCIEDDAKILYKNVSECKHLTGKNRGKNIIIRGDNRKGLIAACVFYACLRKGHTRSPKEIATIFNIKYTDVTKGCKTFIKLIKIKKMDYEVSSSSPEHFVERFCKELHIKKEFIDQAVQIAKNIQKLNIASVHTPLSVATGSIHLMIDINNLPISKKTVAKKFSVSEVTIMKAYKKLEKYKKILVSDEITEKVMEILNNEKKKLQIPEGLKKKYQELDMQSDQQSEEEIIEKKDPVYSFDIKKKTDDIDEYINTINLDIYDQLNDTDEQYLTLN